MIWRKKVWQIGVQSHIAMQHARDVWMVLGWRNCVQSPNSSNFSLTKHSCYTVYEYTQTATVMYLHTYIHTYIMYV